MYPFGPPKPTAVWKTWIPDALNGAKSSAVMESGFCHHLFPFEAMCNGDSMSITVARCINSMARAEYCCCGRCGSVKRPRLNIGARTAAAPSLMTERREVMAGGE
jgi:hypothetical protein